MLKLTHFVLVMQIIVKNLNILSLKCYKFFTLVKIFYLMSLRLSIINVVKITIAHVSFNCICNVHVPILL